MLWFTHNTHMNQIMQINGHKMPSLWKQVNLTSPCIKLVPPTRNPNIDLSLLDHPTLSQPIPLIISYKIP